MGHLGKLKEAKKVKNSPQNIVKVTKTPYFSTFLGLSPGSIGRFCSKVVQMCNFTRSSTSRDPFGRTFLVGLIGKKPALCSHIFPSNLAALYEHIRIIFRFYHWDYFWSCAYGAKRDEHAWQKTIKMSKPLGSSVTILTILMIHQCWKVLGYELGSGI